MKEEAVVVRNIEQIKEDNAARFRRANLWRLRAQSAVKVNDPTLKSLDDNAVRFVFWWIAFEAAYSTKFNSDNDKMKDSVRDMMCVDGVELSKIFRVNKSAVCALVALAPTHDGFWNKRKKYRTHAKWRQDFEREKNVCEKGASAEAMEIIFERLRVVRHQIFHGANSRHKSYGRDQVEYGMKLLAAFVPRFIEIMEEGAKRSPPQDWGKIPFSRQGTRNQKDLLPVWAENSDSV